MPSARHVACLLVQAKDRLSDEKQDYLHRLGAYEPALATVSELAQDFAAIVRTRQSQRFEAWLAWATASEIGERRRFAGGPQDDQAAVEARLRLGNRSAPW